jgi:hypothetical protein
MTHTMSTHLRGAGKSHRGTTKIDILPDDVLLEIFGSIRTLFEIQNHLVWEWHRLVHVCRRWRQIIFASPLRLNLQLLCTYGTPVRKMDCWPPFPLVVDYSYHPYFGDNPGPLSDDEKDNILAALEQRHRVRHVNLSVWYLDLGELIAVMSEPFPALTYLRLASEYLDGPDIPAEFLGGSAPPCLREITLSRIPIPALPPLISSASGLVKPRLESLDLESYEDSDTTLRRITRPITTPKAMVACLAALTRLEYLSLEFLTSSTPPGHSLPHGTRVVFPTLTSLYKGQSAYLDEFVAQINTPRLNFIDIRYTCDGLYFRVTELSNFIGYSNLRPSQFGHAKIYVEGDSKKVSFKFYPKINLVPTVAIQIRSLTLGQYAQVRYMALLLRQTPAMVSDVDHLEIESDHPEKLEVNAFDDITWLDLFLSFTSLESLRVSSRFANRIAEEITVGMATDTQPLPALNSASLEGVHAKTMEGLCAAFQARDRRLTIISFERLDSGIEIKGDATGDLRALN